MNKYFIHGLVVLAMVVSIVSIFPRYQDQVAQAATDLCSAGLDDDDGSGDGILDLTASETGFDGMDIEILNCTIAIDGAHSFNSIVIGDGSGTNDSVLTQSDSTNSVVTRTTLTVTGATNILSDGIMDFIETGFRIGRTSDGFGGSTTTGAPTGFTGGPHAGNTVANSGAQGVTYDSLTQPADPGAGAGSSSSGSHGGGYLRLITDDLNVSGSINAGTTNRANSTGAGGGIWITTTGSLTGAGTISASAGTAANTWGAGGGGRIAFYYDGSQPGNGLTTPYTFEAFGGDEVGGTTYDGGAGTVYVENTNIHNPGEGDIFIDNNGIAARRAIAVTPIPDGTYDDLTILGGAYALSNGTINLDGSLTLNTAGKFAASTLNISGDLDILGTGSILSHTDATNTVVYRLTATVTGDTTIAANSSIDTIDAGFRIGRTSDGFGGSTTTGAPTGFTGGPHAGNTVANSGAQGVTYDSLTQPADPGAGAGTSSTGSHGGGYVRLITTDLNLDGTIGANSSNNIRSSGAGGGIWITTTGSLTGAGTISASAGTAANTWGAGGGGRIAFYYDGSQPGNGLTTPYTFEAFGGDEASGTTYDGGAGTIYVENTDVHAAGEGDVTVDNNGIPAQRAVSDTPLPDGTYDDMSILGNAYALNNGTINLDGDLLLNTAGKFAASTLNISGDLDILGTNSTLSHTDATNSVLYRLTATVTGDTTIEANSSIDTIGAGHRIGRTRSGSGGTTSAGAATGFTGGGHAGRTVPNSGTANASYGSLTQPTDPGAGAGSSSPSSHGGGYVRLITTDLDLEGFIGANSANLSDSTGAGGGIWITTTGSLTGSGAIRASAGNCAVTEGCGGGGRIAFYYDGSQPGNGLTTPYTFEAFGGDEASGTTYDGGAGTIYVENTDVHAVGEGDVTVDNNGITTRRAISDTPLPDGTYDDMSILGNAYALNNGTIGLNGSLTINTAGKFAAATLNIAGDLDILGNGSILSHTDATNSVLYRLEATVSGDTTIEANSSIDTIDAGHRIGRTRSGSGGTTSAGAATGFTGGAHAGKTVANSGATNASYGSLVQPTDPGAGAGSSSTGSHGGGYVRLITTDLNLDGTIGATSSNNIRSSGAGGGIWITTTGSLTGTGTINASAGTAANTWGAGGGGRIAFYYDGSQPGNGLTTPYTLIAIGGDEVSGTTYDGGAGTIYVENTDIHAAGEGDVTVDNNGIPTIRAVSDTPLPDGTYDDMSILGNAYALNNGTIDLDGSLTLNTAGKFAAATLNIAGDLDILGNGSILSHTDATNSVLYRLEATISGDTTIEANSSIDTSDAGHRIGRTSSAAGGTTATGAATGFTGGSHAGRSVANSGAVGITYGSLTEPTDPGAGAGSSSTGSHGGGYVRLITTDLDLEGTIGASTATNVRSSGAGGGIWITTTGSLTGTGTIEASGGNCAGTWACGGGGRIAFYYDSSQSGNSLYPPYTFEAFGGDEAGGTTYDGGAGTIFLKDSQATDGDLTVDNRNISATNSSLLFVTVPAGEPTQYTFRNLSVINQANLEYDSPCSGVAVTVNGVIDLSGGGQLTDGSGGACTTSFATLMIATMNLAPATVGQAYSEILQTVGGYAPLTWDCQGDPGCGSSLPTGLSLNGTTGEISGTPTVAGSFPFTASVIDSDPGGAQSDTQALTLNVGNAPSAPTSLLAEGATNPTNVADPTPEFSAIFSDLDVGDTALQYRIQVDDNNDFSSVVWDSGLTNLGSACANGLRCEDISFGGAPLALDGTQYFWRIRFADQLGVIGAWSEDPTATTNFTMANPVAPSAPTDLKTGNSTNPDFVADQTPSFTAVFNDGDLGDTAPLYQIQVDENNDFSSPIWDSGLTAFGTPCSNGSTCESITFSGTPLELDGATYFWRIRFQDSFGVTGAWSEDPIATTFFTMFDVSAGGPRSPSAGGGGGSGSGSSSSGASSTSAAAGTSASSGLSAAPPATISGVGADFGFLQEELNKQQEEKDDQLPEADTSSQESRTVIPDPICGNSIIESGEQCDDGNLESGDGCSDACQIDEVIPEAELIIISVTPPTRDHGLLVNFQVVGLSAGTITASSGEGVDRQDLVSSEYLPNVQSQLEIPTSLLRRSQSFDFSRIFYEISKDKNFRTLDYNDIFKRALEESEVALMLLVESEDGEASADISTMLDNFPPTTSVDTPEGKYREPINVQIIAN